MFDYFLISIFPVILNFRLWHYLRNFCNIVGPALLPCLNESAGLLNNIVCILALPLLALGEKAQTLPDATSPISQIHPFRQLADIFEPIMFKSLDKYNALRHCNIVYVIT